MPAQPFARFDTETRDKCAGDLKTSIEAKSVDLFGNWNWRWAFKARAAAQAKLRLIRAELDRRHTARLAALAARTGVRCGSILFAEAQQP